MWNTPASVVPSRTPSQIVMSRTRGVRTAAAIISFRPKHECASTVTKRCLANKEPAGCRCRKKAENKRKTGQRRKGNEKKGKGDSVHLLSLASQIYVVPFSLPKALAKLPEAERAAWQKLWADVTEMLAKAQGKTPTEKKPNAKSPPRDYTGA